MKDGSIRTNPAAQSPDVERPFGTADDEFQVMFFFDENGKPVGSLTNFSLHHCIVNCSEYCADYSGVIAKELKLIILIFMQRTGREGHAKRLDMCR